MILFTVVVYVTFGIQGMHLKAESDPFSVAEGGLQFPVCGNCSRVRNDHAGLGFACHSADESAVSKVWLIDVNKKSELECLPSAYKLDRHINHFCCFWSPETGCTEVIGRLYYDKRNLYCQVCKEYCLGSKNFFDDKDGSYKNSAFGCLIAMALVVLWMCHREHN
ncbi:uncharacterized protein LOC108107892 [Drosophila eugracilis]|uniref:uncharacterized protein LOC108107892 n=1 Tax=Drosophila eugracilis TaxID=29029 RepID=UPI0007E6FA96|nr:uncharacterized protein LOC108107892 [Drosophila eugracilis]